MNSTLNDISPRLELSEGGLAFAGSTTPGWSFAWDHVTRVETYKLDLFVVDRICLDFTVEPCNRVYSTHDDMQGFRELCSQLRRHFPTIDERWGMDVAFPAFTSNKKVLYQR